MVGKTISHYKIIEKLGESDVNKIHHAENTKLNIKLSLKFLSTNIVTKTVTHYLEKDAHILFT